MDPEGDMVSYRGDKWLLLEVTGSPNQPMTAKIQQATHADAVAIKVVKSRFWVEKGGRKDRN